MSKSKSVNQEMVNGEEKTDALRQEVEWWEKWL